MANKKGGATVEMVRSVIEPIISELQLELWDVRYVKEGVQWYLRVFIDKPEGVNIEDCEKVSRAIDGPIDEINPIEQSYCLEVCSPGIERELIREEHFNRFIGANVIVKMIRPIEGIGKEFGGVLKACDKNQVTIEDHSGENSVVINKKDAVWIKLDDFDI